MSIHVERVSDALESAGIEVNEVRQLPTGLGQQLRCAGGAVVVVYRTGKTVVQGKGAEAAKAALKGLEGAVSKPASPKSVRITSETPPIIAGVPGAAATDERIFWNDLPWNGADLPWDPAS